MPRPFRSELVLDEKINDAQLRAYHVGFEDNQFRLQPLVDVIRRVIPEFALGDHDGTVIKMTESVEKLKLAAETVYDTDKYKKRGEFGELILHLLLRDFFGTTPLVSKIYFKDSNNFVVHGFDGVQTTINGGKRRLWLGESKLYSNGKAGVASLVQDLIDHTERDYLRKEFNLISRKVPSEFPNREEILSLMDQHRTLEDIFTYISIPLVCTYSSDLFKSHAEASKEYFTDFYEECQNLYSKLDDADITTNIDAYLLLLQVQSKDELNDALHQRLKAMQGI